MLLPFDGLMERREIVAEEKYGYKYDVRTTPLYGQFTAFDQAFGITQQGVLPMAGYAVNEEGERFSPTSQPFEKFGLGQRSLAEEVGIYREIYQQLRIAGARFIRNGRSGRNDADIASHQP
ncbi:MAG: hypothetical protein AB1656_13850 [Candidatus Omnitrophota bacterium]